MHIMKVLQLKFLLMIDLKKNIKTTTSLIDFEEKFIFEETSHKHF